MQKYIKLNEIKISDCFAKTFPSREKMLKVEEYYVNNHKKIDQDIVVDKNNVLVDGYIRYLILKKYNVKKTRQWKYNYTTYIYGKHPNNQKEYVWQVTNKTRKKHKLKPDKFAKVKTSKGEQIIQITRIEHKVKPIKSDKKIKYVVAGI